MTMSGDSCEPDTQLELIANYKPIQPEKNKKKKKICENLCVSFGDYSENTTIHGIKYLGERERSTAERVWWVIGFIICIACLGYFIYIIVDKWQKSPVIVTTDDTKTPIYNVPFPAITLCPETKMRSRLFNYTDTTNKLIQHSQLSADQQATNLSIKYFEAMSHVCEYEHFVSTDHALWKGKQFMDKSYVRTIQNLAPDYNELFVGCKWGNETDCIKILTPIITDAGQCYTFNIITGVFRNAEVQNDYYYFDAHRPAKHWNFDLGYTSDAIDEAHPKRAMSMGRRHGLVLILRNYNDDLNYLCRNGDYGYKITMHNPTEYPQPIKQFVRVPHGKNAQFKITPKIVKTAKTLNSYSPERRQCFFNHERRLRFFRTYNQMNCKLECVSNLTYTKCGCNKFSLPRGRGVPICGAEKIECYAPIWNDWENDVLLKEFQWDYYHKNDSTNVRMVDSCNCLPECTMVQYSSEYQSTSFNFEREIQEFNRSLVKSVEAPSNREYTITKIELYFGSTHFYGETRSELYGISDLVSNFGGLLGLFMGGSILSLIELLYFCTIRNFCNGRRNKTVKVLDTDLSTVIIDN